MPNLSVLLSAVINVVDTTLTPSETVISRQLNDPTLQATEVFYDGFFQTINGTVTVNLPGATVWFLYIRNLSAAGPITITFTPQGGSPETLVLNPGAAGNDGGIFLYAQPNEANGGISALTITAAAVLPVCIIAAA